ncbi:hypothetical protein NM688_g2888 [Phlebia brevispora]|uniref:Uncharacterized protein n=1 Tax=Phlebia brevispora TaxID=194682 RepID=A0ACC1T7E1_9APHY|nr:hypothetical protein NM688_g2888 [Phlebia brevispora]
MAAPVIQGMRFALFYILLFGPLVAFARFDTITFSPVQQCGNFTVSFSGGKPPSSLPLTLTVVPLNGTPIAIDIPSTDWNSATVTGAAITFLPFPAGTAFVASLDDANGVGTGPVSAVITVDSSNNSSCLANGASEPAPRYTLASSLSQCELFDVQWTSSLVDGSPVVRAFVPNNMSMFANLTTSEGTSPDEASYILGVPEGNQVVLTFSDDTGFQQATNLLVIGGNESSPTSCLSPTSAMSQSSSKPTEMNLSDTPQKGSLSKDAAIIIGVVTGCAVGLIAIAMVLWISRERRRMTRKNMKTLEEPAEENPQRRSCWPWGGNRGPGGRVTKRSVTLSLPKRSGISGVARNGSIRLLKDPPYTEVTFEMVTPSFGTRRTADLDAGQDTTGDAPLSSIPVPLTTPLPLETTAQLAVDTSQKERDGGSAGGSPPPTGVKPSSLLSPDDIENILDTARLFAGSATSLVAQGAPGAQGVSDAQAAPDVKSTSTPSVMTAASSIALPKSPAPALLTPRSTPAYRDPPQALCRHPLCHPPPATFRFALPA